MEFRETVNFRSSFQYIKTWLRHNCWAGPLLSMAEKVCCDAFSGALAYSLVKLDMSYVSLKEEQLSAIRAVYNGKDVFVCLPTGYARVCAIKRYLLSSTIPIQVLPTVLH